MKHSGAARSSRVWSLVGELRLKVDGAALAGSRGVVA